MNSKWVRNGEDVGSREISNCLVSKKHVRPKFCFGERMVGIAERIDKDFNVLMMAEIGWAGKQIRRHLHQKQQNWRELEMGLWGVELYISTD